MTEEVPQHWPPRPDEVQEIAPSVQRILAPNASSMTFEGTNSYVVAGGGGSLVIDPGADDETHLEVLARTATADGISARGILLTHDHPDHSDGAQALAARLGAPILAMSKRFADELITDDQRLMIGDVDVHVIHTPGHSEDSVCVWLPEHRTLLTGDTVLGARTATIMGDLGDLFRSLTRLSELAGDDDLLGLPGHGREFSGFVESLNRVRQVRSKRVDDVRAILLDGDTSVGAITRRLYPDATGTRSAFAMTTVFSTLEYILGLTGDEGVPDGPLREAARAGAAEFRRYMWARNREAEEARSTS